MPSINITDLMRSIARSEIDKDKDSIGNYGFSEPPDISYKAPIETPAPDPSPGHPVDQVTDQTVPELQTPNPSEITYQQVLVYPTVSSDNPSVSVDIIIDGSAEKYEINWVTA